MQPKSRKELLALSIPLCRSRGGVAGGEAKTITKTFRLLLWWQQLQNRLLLLLPLIAFKFEKSVRALESSTTAPLVRGLGLLIIHSTTFTFFVLLDKVMILWRRNNARDDTIQALDISGQVSLGLMRRSCLIGLFYLIH